MPLLAPVTSAVCPSPFLPWFIAPSAIVEPFHAYLAKNEREQVPSMPPFGLPAVSGTGGPAGKTKNVTHPVSKMWVRGFA